MKKLTAEVARRNIHLLKEMQSAPNIGLSMRSELFLQALEIALPILEQQERVCQKCGGTGEMDSGGTQPWGAQILVECDCQFEQRERGDSWIEWGGGEQPVNGDVMVETKWSDGSVSCGEASEWRWDHRSLLSNLNIIAYRIIPGQPTNQNGEQ